MNRSRAQTRWLRRAKYAALVTAILALTLLLDQTVWELLATDDKRALERRDWYQALRQVGYLPAWLVIAAGFMLADRARPPTPEGLWVAPTRPARPWHHRGGLIALSSTLSGLAAEVAKMVLSRERPSPVTGTIDYHTLFSGFAQGPAFEHGLGGPSSHAATAWGGVLMVGFLIPASRWAFFPIAAGCALTRLMAGAHALSGVAAGTLIAVGIAGWLWRTGRGPRRGPADGITGPVV
ncbi:MAG: phosphatase PAP2 family protein [Planctomycetota bacterium]